MKITVDSHTITRADQLASIIKVLIPPNYLWALKQYFPLDQAQGDEIKEHTVAGRIQATVYLHSRPFSENLAITLVNFSSDIYRRTGQTIPHSIMVVSKETALKLQHAS